MIADTLIARLESAGEGSRELDAEIALHCFPHEWHEAPDNHLGMTKEDYRSDMIAGIFEDDAFLPASQSLDAAIALVTRLLPGAKIGLFVGHLTSAKDGSGARAQVIRGRGPKCPHTGIRWPRMEGECLYAATPALALVIAALKALEARK